MFYLLHHDPPFVSNWESRIWTEISGTQSQSDTPSYTNSYIHSPRRIRTSGKSSKGFRVLPCYTTGLKKTKCSLRESNPVPKAENLWCFTSYTKGAIYSQARIRTGVTRTRTLRGWPLHYPAKNAPHGTCTHITRLEGEYLSKNFGPRTHMLYYFKNRGGRWDRDLNPGHSRDRAIC